MSVFVVSPGFALKIRPWQNDDRIRTDSAIQPESAGSMSELLKLGVVVLVLFVGVLRAHAEQPSKRPNILFIFADDPHWNILYLAIPMPSDYTK